MPDEGDTVTTTKVLHDYLTFHVLKAGVGEISWQNLVKNIERKSDRRQLLIREFLFNLKDNEWKNIDTVWNLPNATPEMWDNMFSLYVEEPFPEVIRLRRAYRALKERWLQFKEELKAFIKHENEKDD